MLVQLLLKNRGNDNHTDVTHLSQIRINKGFAVADVCRKTGLSYDNYIKYEREEVKIQHMNINTLQKLSNVFGINLLHPYHIFKLHSAEIVKEYMVNNRLSIRDSAKYFKTSVTTIKHWRKGICSPSYEMWEKYFKNNKK